MGKVTWQKYWKYSVSVNSAEKLNKVKLEWVDVCGLKPIEILGLLKVNLIKPSAAPSPVSGLWQWAQEQAGSFNCLMGLLIYLGGRKRRIISTMSAVFTQAVNFILMGMTISAQINAVTPEDKPGRCGSTTGANKYPTQALRKNDPGNLQPFRLPRLLVTIHAPRLAPNRVSRSIIATTMDSFVSKYQYWARLTISIVMVCTLGSMYLFDVKIQVGSCLDFWVDDAWWGEVKGRVVMVCPLKSVQAISLRVEGWCRA